MNRTHLRWSVVMNLSLYSYERSGKNLFHFSAEYVLGNEKYYLPFSCTGLALFYEAYVTFIKGLEKIDETLVVALNA